MRLNIFLVVVVAFAASNSFGQDDDYARTQSLAYDNAVYREDIRSVQCFLEEARLSYPVIMLGSGTSVQLHFDQMAEDFSDFTFYAIHCDAQWKPTDLESNEYIEGFPQQDITEFESSFNTRNAYVHYSLEFPNDMMRIRLSGNYLLVVFEDGDINNLVLSRRIVVYEERVTLGGQVKNSSTIAHRFTHHEIDFSLQHESFSIMDAHRDLHVVLLQNLDWSTARNNIQPQFIKNNEITYDLYEVNEFEAGNEYREFDTKDLRYITMEVASVDEMNKNITVNLLPDVAHGSKGYLSNYDLNGRYFVRNDWGGNNDMESEYHLVNFVLSTAEFPIGQVYVVGGFTDGQYHKNFRMKWNSALHSYELSAWLKQGFYNYRYVVTDYLHPAGSWETTEGNYEQTENDYFIIVYHHDHSIGYDRIIGFKVMNSARP
ncbi:MAG: DUF5103 domain-containing protein [Flavobacteriales bacterium]|mgnify:CR=1 FL=1|nr:DUF5103 domain-containing protein [Flavobacteriales bacterium]